MNTFPYKLAAIDIDDTLVGPDKRVSPKNRAAIERLQSAGCRVVLASGRRHDNMLPFCRALGLGDYLVSCQGAVVRHCDNGELLHGAFLSASEAGETAAEGLERGLTVMYWSADGVFARQRSRWTEQYSSDCGGDPVTLLDVESLANAGAPPGEKVVWGAEPTVIAALAPEMRRRYDGRLIVTVTDDWFMEFATPAATKAAGVAAVARRYDLDRRQVVAFGDGNNDVPLLEWAGLGVAMPHGRHSAREAANWIAPAGDPETALSRAVAQIFSDVQSDSGDGDECLEEAA